MFSDLSEYTTWDNRYNIKFPGPGTYFQGKNEQNEGKEKNERRIVEIEENEEIKEIDKGYKNYIIANI